jgi:hypothetical protein
MEERLARLEDIVVQLVAKVAALEEHNAKKANDIAFLKQRLECMAGNAA